MQYTRNAKKNWKLWGPWRINTIFRTLQMTTWHILRLFECHVMQMWFRGMQTKYWETTLLWARRSCRKKNDSTAEALHIQSSRSTLIAVHFPLLQSLSETLQAAIPSSKSRSALKIILSPGLDSEGSTLIFPSFPISVCMNKLTGWIIFLLLPMQALILSRQLAWPPPLW